MNSSSPASADKKKLNLALQGGGSHGAFAWGALDAILEDARIEIDAISATSAGAMNACAAAYGHHLGGAERARQELEKFWRNVSESGLLFNPVKKLPWEDFIPGDKKYPSSFFLFDWLSRAFSPYQTNPYNFNPLRKILEKSIDFEALRTCQCIKLFISATNVHTSKIRVFKTGEITLDVVMASACLPHLYKAVEIEGTPYWDGGYVGNPALHPLFYHTQTRDVMIVNINPIERHETPTSAEDILNRENEISFNASLLDEMRAISFVQKLLRKNMLKDEYRSQFMDVLVHVLRADETLCDLSVASKYDSSWAFLTDLRDRGRAAMKDWLKVNFDKIGREDTIDLRCEFLDKKKIIKQTTEDS